LSRAATRGSRSAPALHLDEALEHAVPGGAIRFVAHGGGFLVTDDELIHIAGLDDKLNIKGKVNPQKASIEVSESLDRNFMIEQVGSRTFYTPMNDPERVAFIEKGDTLSTIESDPAMIKHMLQVAEDRGWESITLDGSDKFRQEAWLEAKARGIEVEGYEPTAQDIRRMETELPKREMSSQLESSTGIEEDKSAYAKELKAAMSTLSKDDAIKKHPELKEAYELQSSASAFYKQQGGLSADQENAFVSRTTDKAIDDLANGRDLPKIEVQNQKAADVEPVKKPDREIDFD